MFYDEKADYKAFLQDCFQDVAEITALAGCINSQVDRLSQRIRAEVGNKSIEYADERGVARWESILSVSSPLTGSLKSRKEALKAKLMTKPPINLKSLKGIIEAYLGLAVDLSIVNYRVLAQYRGESKIKDISPLYATVYEIIPANLLLEISYRYMIWNELDAQQLLFDGLDAKSMSMDVFERGEWVGTERDNPV